MQIDVAAASAGGFTSELKFVVDAAVAQRVREWARQRLEADPHGTGPWSDEYCVSSVYFDTAGRDVFHRRGSFGRSKYRIRRYAQDSTVFLERKLRNGTRLAKRRTGIDVATLPLLAGSSLNGDATAWFRRRVALRQLRPVCQVSYTRIARAAGTSDGPVRLTLDDNLTATASDSLIFQSQPGTSLLDGRCIVELKYRDRVPAIVREVVESFALRPERWSKYRAAAQALGLVPPAPELRVPSASNG
jgi:hypothetical protein